MARRLVCSRSHIAPSRALSRAAPKPALPALRRLLLILIELENDDQRSSGRFVLCHLTSESSEDHHDWVAFGVRVIGVSLAHDLRVGTPAHSRIFPESFVQDV